MFYEDLLKLILARLERLAKRVSDLEDSRQAMPPARESIEWDIKPASQNRLDEIEDRAADGERSRAKWADIEWLIAELRRSYKVEDAAAASFDPRHKDGPGNLWETILRNPRPGTADD